MSQQLILCGTTHDNSNEVSYNSDLSCDWSNPLLMYLVPLYSEFKTMISTFVGSLTPSMDFLGLYLQV